MVHVEKPVVGAQHQPTRPRAGAHRDKRRSRGCERRLRWIDAVGIDAIEAELGDEREPVVFREHHAVRVRAGRLTGAQCRAGVVIDVQRIAQRAVRPNLQRGERRVVAIQVRGTKPVVGHRRERAARIDDDLIRETSTGARLVQQRQRSGLRVDGVRAHRIRLRRVGCLPVRGEQELPVWRRVHVCRVHRRRDEAQRRDGAARRREPPAVNAFRGRRRIRVAADVDEAVVRRGRRCANGCEPGGSGETRNGGRRQRSVHSHGVAVFEGQDYPRSRRAGCDKLRPDGLKPEDTLRRKGPLFALFVLLGVDLMYDEGDGVPPLLSLVHRAAADTDETSPTTPAGIDSGPQPPSGPNEGKQPADVIAAPAVAAPVGGSLRRAHYGLSLKFERRPGDQELGRLVENTIWVNETHPAYERAQSSRSMGYHIALTVALALAPLAAAASEEHLFVTRFLSEWGTVAGTRRPERRRSRVARRR